MKLLVVGGTGTVGSAVTAEAARRGVEVTVTTRNAGKAQSLPPGVSGVVGDLDRPETLGSAFAGADAVFVATALSPTEVQMGLNAIEAAKAAHLHQFVYMSVHRADEFPQIPHFASKIPIQDSLRSSGLAYTILQPNHFFQNDLSLLDPILKYGVYPQPLSPKGTSRVDVADIALAAVNSLTDSTHQNQTYPLVGPEALTGEQCARIYSKVTGREVTYTGADLDGWMAAARRVIPEWMAADLAIMFKLINERGLAATPEELEQCERVLGGAPRRFETWANEVVSGWRNRAES